MGRRDTAQPKRRIWKGESPSSPGREGQAWGLPERKSWGYQPFNLQNALPHKLED